MTTPHQQGVQSVEIGMHVLAALERGGGPMPLSKIAAVCRLAPSKTHRYLVSLVRTGFVAQEADTGLYNLGPAARTLGVEALRRVDEVGTASRHAAGLRDRTGHTVYLALWTDAGPSLVRQDHGWYPLPIMVRVGSILPVLDSAIGRAFLAYLPEPMTAPVLRAQQRRKETSDLSPQRYAQVLEEIRSTGLSTVRGSLIAGLNVVAAPTFGADGRTEVVIAVAMPARFDRDEEFRRVGDLLVATARTVSTELGHSGF